MRLALVAISLLLLCTAMIGAGCGPSDEPKIPKAAATHADTEAKISETPAGLPLADRARSLGIDFTYRNGSEADLNTILESLGGGVAWIDYDRDGWPDLLATGGGKLAAGSITGLPCQLFRNVAGERFEVVGLSAGIQSSALYSHGIAVADYDNDGFQDFVVTGYGPPQLWQNMGDGTFLEGSTAAGIVDSRWSSSAGWADLNGDGLLDLYLAHYVNWSFENDPVCQTSDGKREICPPRSFNPLPDTIYFNNGDGTFADVSAAVGLRKDGKGLGVLLCDVDGDGDLDIYVANDTTDNFLYINDGQGHFAEEALARGVALDDQGIPNGSMGVDLCDFNSDGRPDIWVANYERESFALYRNEGKGNFLHVSQRFGITDLGGLFVGFGTACEDFDGDGDGDMVVANGHVIKYPVASPRKQLPLLLLYDGKRFRRREAPPDEYFGQPHEGRGLATADFDRDGDLDIAISHIDEPLALLENRFREQNHWVAVELIGVQSNRDAIGARLELKTADKTYVRQVTGGGSYLSHSSRIAHFALPNAAPPESLTVYWPSGRQQTIAGASLQGFVTLIEPPGE